MNRNACIALWCFWGLFWGASAASADIVATSGQIEVLLLPPPSVYSGDLESSEFIRVFQERKALQLPSSVSVNIQQTGVTTTYTPDVSDPGSDNPGIVPAGTVVNTYMVHFDPLGSSPETALSLAGSLTFSEPILGLILFKDELNDTDELLGALGTVYGAEPAHPNRGLEDNADHGPDDQVTLFADEVTLSIDNVFAGTGIDEIRVLTVPEPGSLGLLVLAVTLLTRRRRG